MYLGMGLIVELLELIKIICCLTSTPLTMNETILSSSNKNADWTWRDISLLCMFVNHTIIIWIRHFLAFS